MADTKELGPGPEVTTFEPTNSSTLNLPQGWMYRQRKIGSLLLPWYASPKVQLLMVSMVCFLCPGMFNALGGLGGGGKADATLADNMVKSTLQGPLALPCSNVQSGSFEPEKKHVMLTPRRLERSALQHLCRHWFLRGYLCESPGRQADAVLRRARLLHLRHQSAG
jgi:hypothetical protein